MKTNLCNFKDHQSIITSRQPNLHNTQIHIGTIENTKTKSTLIGCDIIVNLPSQISKCGHYFYLIFTAMNVVFSIRLELLSQIQICL